MKKGPSFRVTIESLGARGDGIATPPEAASEAEPDGSRGRGRQLFVPFALPGEAYDIAAVERKGSAEWAIDASRITAAPERVTPSCPHFGVCGGCAIQHMNRDAAAAFKADLLRKAIARAGFDPALVRPTLCVPPGRRRRAKFSYRRTGRGWIVGFSQRASHRLVDIKTCPVLTPALQAAPALLRDLLARAPECGPGGEVQVTDTQTGLDITLSPGVGSGLPKSGGVAANPRRGRTRKSRAKPDTPHHSRSGGLAIETREAIADWAELNLVARVNLATSGGIEPIVARRSVHVSVAGRPVDLPAASFLQPSVEGAAILADCVLDGLASVHGGPVGRAADLFCGGGALTIPLSGVARSVHAVDLEGPAIDALNRALQGPGLAPLPITTERRDLFRQPLEATELAKFDAVVFDPPRAGAEAQARQLAHSAVATVIAVSCNPATLARDLRTLAAGGYRLASATPMDQFTWSAHVEAVAVLHR